ncbi:hypothetical protein L3Y34_005456 [Caenorhabditis briggsae]|uniref:Uncharacterized protein n=1 Tax=Caenorhabditis briggsae TaxID=6238 RepID=A0AAE9AER5_CAEBR|nr:hypothetical protein L3Y34_005456 [Caenorhabditis briggsae]
MSQGLPTVELGMTSSSGSIVMYSTNTATNKIHRQNRRDSRGKESLKDVKDIPKSDSSDVNRFRSSQSLVFEITLQSARDVEPNDHRMEKRHTL